jgi:hypothetical protein
MRETLRGRVRLLVVVILPSRSGASRRRCIECRKRFIVIVLKIQKTLWSIPTTSTVRRHFTNVRRPSSKEAACFYKLVLTNMDECPNTAGIFARIACILSYGGSVFDCWINYFLLLTSVTGWILYVNNSQRFLRESCYRPLESSSPRPSHAAAAGALVFLVIFQISLCLILQCSGISIIWCGITGWMLTEGLYRRGSFGILVLPLLCNLSGMIYYAITAEAITTVAHICAVILGSVLYYLGYRLAPKTSESTESSASREAK